jgi:hypothetical protein
MTTNAVPTPMHQTRTHHAATAAIPGAPTKLPRAASVSASVAAFTAPVSLYPQFEQAAEPTLTPATPATPVAASTATTWFACYAPRKRKRSAPDGGADASDAHAHRHLEFSGASAS